MGGLGLLRRRRSWKILKWSFALHEARAGELFTHRVLIRMFFSVKSYSKCLLALTPLAFSLSGTAQAQSVTRGRDPWAFRMILENKTRILVLALKPDLWAAYNPANGTLHKVWSGGITFQGKVWDYSAKNSFAQGTTYHLLEDAIILSATSETSIPAGWQGTGITTGSAWGFSNASSSLASPTFDLTRYRNVMVHYFPSGSGSPLRVDVSTNAGTSWNAQYWTSLPTAPDEGNHKQLAVSGNQVKLRFVPSATPATTLQDIKVFGDYQAWSAAQNGTPLVTQIDWRGYKLIQRTQGIIIRYDAVLPGNVRVAIEEQPEATAGVGLTRRFSVVGLPAGVTLSLELDGVGYTAGHTISGQGTLRSQNNETYLDFSGNGDTTLTTTWAP